MFKDKFVVLINKSNNQEKSSKLRLEQVRINYNISKMTWQKIRCVNMVKIYHYIFKQKIIVDNLLNWCEV